MKKPTKLSIAKILSNLSGMLLLNTFFVVIVAAFILEQNYSYKKIENLDEQKRIIQSLMNIPREDIELAKIQFNGKSDMLLVKINQLKQLYTYDFVGNYIIFSKKEYLTDLDELVRLTKAFNKAAEQYYTTDHSYDEENRERLMQAFAKLNGKIDELYIKNVRYNKQKSFIIAQFATIMLVLSIITTLWYRRRIKTILDDILFLSAIHANKPDHEIKTIEMDAIRMRMRRKTGETGDKSLIDPVTEILNHKGLRAIYGQKKNLKGSYFTSVTVIEIDNFSKSNRGIPQELVQSVLKKVAFTLSLFEQAADVIARTDYNQFTIILVRESKEQCLKDIETIQQNISEIKFKLPNGKTSEVSISGGFVLKPNNKTLEETIKQALQALHTAKQKGGGTIAQSST